MDVLLIGRTEDGTIDVLLIDASWATVRSVADSLQAHATVPIEWDVTYVSGASLTTCRLNAVGDERPLILAS